MKNNQIDDVDNAATGTRLDDLQYNQVIELCRQFSEANSTNNIKKRTSLLRQYPELFDMDVQAKIEKVLKDANQVTKHTNSRNKIVRPDPKLFRK